MADLGFICPDDVYLKFPIKQITLMDFKMDNISIKLDSLHRAIIDIVIINPNTGKSISIKALIDTGSPYCFLTKKTIDFLELKKISDVESISFMSEKTLGEYEALFSLNNSPNAKGLHFREFDNKSAFNIDCLIGTNLLQFFEFNYNNPKKEFSLKYVG